MAGGEGGHSQKSQPGFRADAQLGDELLRHSAIREDSNAGALDENGKGSGIYGMKSFVRKLKHDLAAVKNALRESWSNGPVEGHINRPKTLKRQMYGRAGFELLRARLLRCLVASRCTESEEEPMK
jgi:transposase